MNPYENDGIRESTRRRKKKKKNHPTTLPQPIEWSASSLDRNHHRLIAGPTSISIINLQEACRRIQYDQFTSMLKVHLYRTTTGDPLVCIILGQSASNHQTQDHFRHSGDSVSKIFHHILRPSTIVVNKFLLAKPSLAKEDSKQGLEQV